MHRSLVKPRPCGHFDSPTVRKYPKILVTIRCKVCYSIPSKGEHRATPERREHEMSKTKFTEGESYFIFRDNSGARVKATCVGRTKRTVKLQVPIDKAIKMGWLSEWNRNPNMDTSTVTIRLVDKANESCEHGTFIEHFPSYELRFTASADC